MKLATVVVGNEVELTRLDKLGKQYSDFVFGPSSEFVASAMRNQHRKKTKTKKTTTTEAKPAQSVTGTSAEQSAGSGYENLVPSVGGPLNELPSTSIINTISAQKPQKDTVQSPEVVKKQNYHALCDVDVSIDSGSSTSVGSSTSEATSITTEAPKQAVRTKPTVVSGTTEHTRDDGLVDYFKETHSTQDHSLQTLKPRSNPTVTVKDEKPTKQADKKREQKEQPRQTLWGCPLNIDIAIKWGKKRGEQGSNNAQEEVTPKEPTDDSDSETGGSESCGSSCSSATTTTTNSSDQTEITATAGSTEANPKPVDIVKKPVPKTHNVVKKTAKEHPEDRSSKKAAADDSSKKKKKQAKKQQKNRKESDREEEGEEEKPFDDFAMTAHLRDVHKREETAKNAAKKSIRQIDTIEDCTIYHPDNFESAHRRLVVFRHAERIDRVFPSWISLSTQKGEYAPFNLNCPPNLPKRRSGIKAFALDPPISVNGQITAQLVGKSLRRSRLPISAIYSSPALRCMQTAAEIVRECGNPNLRVCIEPGLFDWCGWYDMFPVWMTAEELTAAGFPVDEKYKAVITREGILRNSKETKHDYYRRGQNVATRLLAASSGSVVFVGHATTVDASVRPLLDRDVTAPSFRHMDRLDQRYPYCSSVMVDQIDEGGQWSIQHSLLPLNSVGFTTKIDHKFLLRK